MSGPCSFSEIIACCITCRRNGTGSLSLMSPVTFLLKLKVILYAAAPRGLISSSTYVSFLGIWISTQAIAISVFILLSSTCPFPTVPSPCESILFRFALSMAASGPAPFCIPCNTQFLNLSGAPSPILLPHLPRPFILKMPFPFCCRCAFRTPPNVCRLDRSLPSIVLTGCTPPLTRTPIGNSVPTARFVLCIFPSHLAAL